MSMRPNSGVMVGVILGPPGLTHSMDPIHHSKRISVVPISSLNRDPTAVGLALRVSYAEAEGRGGNIQDVKL